MINKINRNGFTLVELLVVISIISILTIISMGSYRSIQIKARDGQRKSDLNAVSKALMLYFSDKGVFPASFPFGNISVGFTGGNGIVYMRQTPLDPRNESANGYQYVYIVDATFKKFNLYTNLENTKDSQCQLLNGVGIYSVGGKNYCYGIASPNTVVNPSLP